jgi:hypothetical protein
MNAGAGVNSLAVLHDWVASLTTFRSEAQEALTSLALALQRAEDWLEEQQRHWHRQIRIREDAVTQAKADLATRQISNTSGHRVDCTVQEKNLRRAKDRLEEAKDRLDAVRRWMLRWPREVCDTWIGPAGQLAGFVEGDLPSGLALLARQLIALEQYAAVASPEKEKP